MIEIEKSWLFISSQLDHVSMQDMCVLVWDNVTRDCKQPSVFRTRLRAGRERGSGTRHPTYRSIKGSLKIFSPRVKFEGQPQVHAFEPVCGEHPP